MRRQPLGARLVPAAGALLLWAVLLPSVGAAAQPSRTPPPRPPSEADTERARSLFREGLRDADRGRWQRAADRFESALSLRPAPPIRYNLAAAYLELDRALDAGRQIDLVLTDPTTTDEVRTQARDLLRRIDARTSRVTVRLAGSPASRRGVTVALDDEPVTITGDAGTTVRVAPGAHVAVARRGTEVVGRAQAALDAGQATAVTITLVPSPAEAAATEAPAPAPVLPATGDDDDDDSTVPIVVGVGVGAAVVLVGIVVIAVVATRGVEDPVQGDLDPGVVRVGR